MRLGNCWLYAISVWTWHGGAIVVCWSPRNVCVSHAMRAADAESITYTTRGLLPSVATLFREGGYLVLRWRADLPCLAVAGHTDSVAGLEVSEFIPTKAYTGASGVIRAICFPGRVRRRVMPGPDDTMTGMR